MWLTIPLLSRFAIAFMTMTKQVNNCRPHAQTH
jgi:hypothetical protein